MSAVETDPNVLWGIPVFCGTHVPAVTLFDYLAIGGTMDEFLEDFPSVRRELAEQVLSEAAPTQ